VVEADTSEEILGLSDDEGMGELPEGAEGQDVEKIGLQREGEFIRKMVDPKLPTEKEVEEHYLAGHIPYRNWCPVCVRAKGKEMGHMRGEGNERGLPEYSWDYCFPGNEMGYKWVVLVGRERGSRGWMATAVQGKNETAAQPGVPGSVCGNLEGDG
jgi:hypothetical protein